MGSLIVRLPYSAEERNWHESPRNDCLETGKQEECGKEG